MRFFFGLTFALLTVMASSQSFNIQAGYRVGHGFMDRLNDIITAYNKNEPNVLRPMAPLHFLHGPALGVGASFNGLAINLGYSAVSGSTTSQVKGTYGGTRASTLQVRSST